MPNTLQMTTQPEQQNSNKPETQATETKSTRWARFKHWIRDVFGNHYGKIGVGIGILTCGITYFVAPLLFSGIVIAFAPIMLPLLVTAVITSVIALVAYAVGKVLTDNRRTPATQGFVEDVVAAHNHNDQAHPKSAHERMADYGLISPLNPSAAAENTPDGSLPPGGSASASPTEVHTTTNNQRPSTNLHTSTTSDEPSHGNTYGNTPTCAIA